MVGLVSKPSLDSGNAEPPKCSRATVAVGVGFGIVVEHPACPTAMPADPAGDQRRRGGTSGCTGPSATAGSVCRMITPPMSCRSMENCGSRKTIASERADLDHQRGDLGDLRLLRRGGVLLQVLLVDVAGEQVRRGDRHDRGGHQRADADRGERDARRTSSGTSGRTAAARSCCVDLAGPRRSGVTPAGDGHEAEQRDQAEQRAVGRQRAHVPLDARRGCWPRARR